MGFITDNKHTATFLKESLNARLTSRISKADVNSFLNKAEQQIIAFVPIAAKDWVHAFKNPTCMNSFVEQLQSKLQNSSDKQLADIITQTVDDNEHLFDQEVLPFFRSGFCGLIERRFNLL